MSFPGRRLFAVTAVLAGMGVSSPGSAQNAKPAPAPAPPPRFAIPGSADSVSRGGKTPAAPTETKKAKKRGHAQDSKPRPNAAVATFPGFRLLPDGRSRIYVELSKSVTVEEHRTDAALTFTLHDAQVLVKNNKNALITTHFSTPVSRARLVPAGNDINLVLDLRKVASATHQLVAGDNGSARLEIDFPAGDYPLEPGRFEPQAGGSYRRGAGGSDSEAPETIDDVPPPAPPKAGSAEPKGAGPPTP
jgi:hypothetical protein